MKLETRKKLLGSLIFLLILIIGVISVNLITYLSNDDKTYGTTIGSISDYESNDDKRFIIQSEKYGLGMYKIYYNIPIDESVNKSWLYLQIFMKNSDFDDDYHLKIIYESNYENERSINDGSQMVSLETDKGNVTEIIIYEDLFLDYFEFEIDYFYFGPKEVNSSL